MPWNAMHPFGYGFYGILYSLWGGYDILKNEKEILELNLFHRKRNIKKYIFNEEIK